MPWTPETFARRHNRKLGGQSASKAAAQANALLKAGVPEGEAIAIANKTGDRMKMRAERRYGGKRA